MKYGEKKIKEGKLEKWNNPKPGRNYNISIQSDEFTCLCPRSGFPDFASIKVNYIPGEFIVELKSFKLYLNRFRNEYISHEETTNRIFDDLKKLLNPDFLEVIADFNPRGNVKTTIAISTENEKKRRRKK